MRIDFSPSHHLEKKNEYNLFNWIVTKEIFSKEIKLKGLDDKDYDTIQKITFNYYNGYSLNLPKNVLDYLELKLSESKNLYKELKKLYENYVCLELKLY